MNGPGTSAARRFSTAVALGAGLSFLGFGLWALAASQSFSSSLARFDPYNQHFVQDIGAFQIGLGAVLVLVTRLADALSVALLGTGVGAAVHVVSHVIGRELGGIPRSTSRPSPSSLHFSSALGRYAATDEDLSAAEDRLGARPAVPGTTPESRFSRLVPWTIIL